MAIVQRTTEYRLEDDCIVKTNASETEPLFLERSRPTLDKVCIVVAIWGMLYFLGWLVWGIVRNNYPHAADFILGPQIDPLRHSVQTLWMW